MARPKETYNKKQREAKKQQHLQEKRQKAEDRKTERKATSLQDMMAYIDENGNLSSTPPDPLKKKEFAVEDIQIGVPKLEDREVPDLSRRGRISVFHKSKGYGFIQESGGGNRVFFHVQYLKADVNEGDEVVFMIANGPRGLHATEIDKPAS